MLPPACPACSSTSLLPIAYGMPTPELIEAAARGEVILGGCVIDRAVLDAVACRHCGFVWDPEPRGGDLSLAELMQLLPTCTEHVGLGELQPGTSFLDPARPVLVRGYDTYEHALVATTETHSLYLDRLRDPHRPRCARLHDTVLYLGESEGIHGLALWEPARVVWMSAFARDGVSRWCLTLTPSGGASPVAVHQLSPLTAVAVEAAAESGRSLDPSLAREAFAELATLVAL